VHLLCKFGGRAHYNTHIFIFFYFYDDLKPSEVAHQVDLVFGLWSWFISKSVYARLQVFVCRGYDLCHPSEHRDTHTHRQTAIVQLIWKAQL